MRGYYKQPEETANAVRDGWMHTGDVARMDEDGYFFLVDRVKDMVIVSGFKVFTRELDEVLAKHRDVMMAASIGMPDPERPGSERVGCAIVLREGVEKSEAEKEKIRAYLKEECRALQGPARDRVHGRAAHQRRGKNPEARIEKDHDGIKDIVHGFMNRVYQIQ